MPPPEPSEAPAPGGLMSWNLCKQMRCQQKGVGKQPIPMLLVHLRYNRFSKPYRERVESAMRDLRSAASHGKQCKLWLYKVPHSMRVANLSDYEPHLFQFGPYNDRIDVQPDGIAACDHCKIEIAKVLTTEGSFERLVKSLEDRVEDIRKLYSDGWHIENGSELAREVALNLALDALTVVAAACYQDCVRPRSMCAVIWRDAFLLEQQLPLFMLQAAIDSIVSVAGPAVRIHDVVNFYALQTSYPFRRNLPAQRKIFDSPMTPLDMQQSLLSQIHTTFTHAVHRSVVSTEFTSLPTASKLQTYGIRFAVGDGGFTGIHFDKKSRVLTLPEITVFSTTKSYLLNLVAQETAISWYDDDPCPVSSYILLMGFLIKAEEDVKALVDSQLLHNHLGSHAELVEMWNALGVNLPISLTQEDSEVINAVREACEAQRLRSVARHHHGNKPSTLLLISCFCR